MFTFKNDWDSVLANEYQQPYYVKLVAFLQKEDQMTSIYPSPEERLTALQVTSYAQTKVVIIGQDPYHGPGQAHGLSFSVKSGVKIPPSLQNIYKELQADVGCPIPNHGSLLKWAEQGVLLLNTVLTVEAGRPNSHQGIGWEIFTDQVIASLNARNKPVIFILWGKNAQEKAQLITAEQHKIIQSAHPSPFAAYRGFFGSRPFSQVNRLLREWGDEEIDWHIIMK